MHGPLREQAEALIKAYRDEYRVNRLTACSQLAAHFAACEDVARRSRP